MTSRQRVTSSKGSDPISNDKWVVRASAILLIVAASACRTTTAPTQQPPDTFTLACPAATEVQSLDGGPVSVTFNQPVPSGGSQPVTTSCSPSPGSSLAPGNNNVTCQSSDAAGHTTSCGFSITVRPPARMQYTRYVSFGDSITYGIGAEPVGLAAFVSQWNPFADPRVSPFFLAAEPYPLGVERRLGSRFPQSFRVLNEGVSGEVAYAGGIARFHTVLLRDQPEVVLLMEGTNDLLNQSGVEPALAALDSMVSDALGQGRQVCIATIPPQRPNGFRAVTAARIPGFNDRIRTIAATRNIVLADVYNAMKDDLSLIGSDDLHPTSRGIAVISDVFTDAVRRGFEQTQIVIPGR